MPKRISIYVLAALAGLAFLLVGIYAGILNTGAGRRAVLGALEPTLEAALGGQVEIGGTGGHWPNNIVLRDVTVADREGVWLRLDELAVRWTPLSLLSGRVTIDGVTVSRGTLVRLPESPKKEDRPPDLPKLPKLPKLRIGSLAIGALDVKAAAAGHDTVLHAMGTADMHPGLLRLSLQAGTEGGEADRADIAIDWTPAEDRLAADIRVTGPEGGLIARLAGVDGRVSVSAGGTGPASDWRGTIEAEAGTFGTLTGKLACECRAPPKLKLDLTANPGPALSETTRRYLGGRPRIGMALYSKEPATLTLEITALDIPAGKLVRPLHVLLTETSRLLRFDVSAVMAPGPVLRDELPPWLGGEIKFFGRGGLTRGGMRLAKAAVTSPAATLTLENARLEPDGSLDGIGSLDISAAEMSSKGIAQLAGEKARLGFDLGGVWGETIRLEDMILDTAAGSRAAGSLAYDLKGAALKANLDLALPATVFAALSGLPAPAKPVTGKLTAEGTSANLSATLEAQAPELKLEARTLPPVRAALTLRGGLENPEGDLVVHRLDKEQEPVVLSARLTWPGRKTLHVTAIGAQLDGATLQGEADIAADTGRITGEAKVDIPDLAAMSAQASGRLNARISLEREAQGSIILSAEGHAPELGYGNLEAQGVEISASGPLSGFTFTGKAELVNMPDTGPVRNLDIGAQAELGKAVKVTIRRLAAIVDGTAVALSAPAQFAVGEGAVALSEAKFSWGEKGSLTAQATLTPETLKASLEMTKAAVPGKPMLVTGSVRMNTDEPAQPGTLSLRLEPRDRPNAALEISGVWSGQRLDLTGNLKSTGKKTGQVAGDILAAGIPLKLTHTDGSLTFDTEGMLDARLRYGGRLEPLLAIFVAEREQELAGVLTADVQVSGTLKAPQMSGSAVLTQGRYEDPKTGVALNAVNARLDFTGATGAASGTLQLTAFDSRKSKGRQPPVTGEGRFTLDPEGFRVNAEIRLRDATLVRRRDLTATLSGDAGLSGILPELTLAGTVRIDRLDLLIPENGHDGIEDVPVVLVNEKGEPLNPKEKDKGVAGNGGGEGPVMRLDLKVRSDGQAFIRGRGLDSEWKVDLSVGGTIHQPELNGALALKKGTFNFAGRSFTLSKGEVTFTGQTPPNPVLDIVAQYKTEATTTAAETTALVQISGRTAEPSVKLESQPPLPREQIMALVLFGKPVKELTALQALQMTQSLAQLTGTGPFGGGSIMDRARRTLGLDLLDLTFGKENGDVGLKVGRYVSQGVFVSASQDVSGEGGKVSVQVELTDEFSIKTDVGQDASGGVSAQWKKDY